MSTWTVLVKSGFDNASWFVDSQHATKQEADKAAIAAKSRDPLDEGYFTLVVRGGKLVDHGLWHFQNKGDKIVAIDK